MKDNFIIDLGFIPFEVMVSINESDEELKECLSDLGIKEEDYANLIDLDPLTTARCAMLPSGQVVIRLFKESDKNRFIGVIAHESFHATSFILERIGVPLETMISDEIYGYMTGFITKTILDGIEQKFRQHKD